MAAHSQRTLTLSPDVVAVLVAAHPLHVTLDTFVFITSTGLLPLDTDRFVESRWHRALCCHRDSPGGPKSYRPPPCPLQRTPRHPPQTLSTQQPDGFDGPAAPRCGTHPASFVSRAASVHEQEESVHASVHVIDRSSRLHAGPR